MGASEVNNLDRYKSYIQRRRVRSASSDGELISRPEPDSEKSETSYAESFADIYRSFSDYGQRSEKSTTGEFKDDSDININSTVENTFKDEETQSSPRESYSSRGQTTTIHRTDPGLYKRLYGQNGRIPRASSYTSSYHGYGSSNHAEIRDNQATVLAVKIIKQALACFAILGIIVLMQQRSDMEGVLTFIRKHLIENHIDSQSVVAGVENIVKECSRFLGGSP